MFQIRVEAPNPNDLGIIDNHKEQYQELLQHPLFTFKNDPDLSPLIKTLDLIIQPKPQLTAIRDLHSKFKEHLFNLIFEKKKLAELQKSNQLNIVQKTTCGKHVAQGELYFRCLDCDINTVPGTVSLLCIECFEKSNHEGHRIILVKKENLSSATCDCGIPEAFKPEGFCSDHQPQEINLKEFLTKFPNILFERYQLVLKKVFYGVISLYEIGQIVKGNRTRTAITALADQCLNELLSFCDDSVEEISESFLVVLGNIFKASFVSPYNAGWHNCKELKAEKLNQKTETLNCSCSILGNLFKFGLIMGKEQQSKIEKIVINCARDSGFKEFMALEMAKFADFLFTKNLVDGDRESLTQESPNSRFLRMTTQLYQSEETMLKVLETGYLNNFMEIFENVIQEAKQINFTVSYIINESICVIDLFLDRRLATSKLLIKEKRTLNSLLRALANFEKRFLYDRMIHIGLFPHNVDYFMINFGLINEKSIRRVVMDGMKQIYKYPKEEKEAILKQLIGDLYSSYRENVVPILGNTEDSLFNLALERTFTACLVNSVNYPITVEDLQDFFKNIVPADVEIDKLSEQFIQSTLKSFGRLRYLTLVHNFDGGMIWGVYYDVAGNMFELDIVLVQLLSMFVKPENLFTTVSNSFFSYSKELQAFFNKTGEESKVLVDDYFKQKLSVMEDFMNFLVYVMNDELSLVNLEFEKKEQQENLELDPRNKRVVEKILVNILVGLYWTNVNQLKSVLETMFKSQANVDEIIKKITIINEKDHKIRIKDDYLSEFDSYMHYKSPAFKQELISSLSSKTQLSQKTDLVSGRHDQDLPSSLKQTQKSFYQSTLPDFLALFLQEFPKEMASLVRPVLKLVLLNLQVLREAIATGDNDQKALRAKAEENYFTEKFSTALTAILEQQQDFKDCERCILKIQSLIKTISSSSNTDLEAALAEEDFAEKKRIEVEEKKRLAKERMEKMKENFSKKQALFADKNKEIIEAEDLTKSPETASKDRITCQYCLEAIDTDSTPYGVPLFVAYTNNLYFDNDEEVKFTPTDFSNLSKQPWWPVVTSCNHYYHQGCFETHTINLRKPNEPINALFREESESQCSLCKTFSNGFLLQKPLALASTMNDIVPDLLPMTLQDLLRDKILKLKDIVPVPNNLKDSEIVPVSLIFERAYSYLVQAFHTQNNPAALQAAIQLYTHFFRGFQYYFFHNQKSIVSHNQPFIDLLIHILSIYQGDENYQETHLKVLKEYLAVRIRDMETLKNNLKQVISTVQKAVFAYHLNLSVLGQTTIPLSELSSLIMSPDNDTEEYLIRLLKTINDPNLVSLDSLANLIQTLPKDQNPPTRNIFPMSPQMLKLPATYAEFNNKYMRMKCSKCHTFGENMLRCLCLICGEFICGLFCDSSKMVFGNLNKHCKEYHMGNGLFIDVHTQAYEVVSSGTNVVAMKHQVYIDQLGQPVTKFLKDNNEVKNLDFKQFTLNPEALDLFKGIINSHNFRQEIFEVTYNNNSAFNDNTL